MRRCRPAAGRRIGGRSVRPGSSPRLGSRAARVLRAVPIQSKACAHGGEPDGGWPGLGGAANKRSIWRRRLSAARDAFGSERTLGTPTWAVRQCGRRHVAVRRRRDARPDATACPPRPARPRRWPRGLQDGGAGGAYGRGCRCARCASAARRISGIKTSISQRPLIPRDFRDGGAVQVGHGVLGHPEVQPANSTTTVVPQDTS